MREKIDKIDKRDTKERKERKDEFSADGCLLALVPGLACPDFYLSFLNSYIAVDCSKYRNI